MKETMAWLVLMVLAAALLPVWCAVHAAFRVSEWADRKLGEVLR